MTEAIFFEKRRKKLLSFIINFILAFGLIFIPVPGDSYLPKALEHLDLIITIFFGIPLLFQLILVFRKTSIQWSEETFQENITWSQNTISSHDIIGYRFIKLLFVRYLIVDVRDMDLYLRKLPFWKKWIARHNLKQVKSPIKIPLNRMEKSLAEIYESIKKVHSL